MSIRDNIRKTESWDASHRGWPLPKIPWTMKQVWNSVLFAHYPVDPVKLKKLMPEQLPLDTFNGMAWVGIVPFYITGLRGRGIPQIPGTNRFPELNVRTYVTIDGKPGIYFFSLDAMNSLAVQVARTFLHLPYVYADMSVKEDGFLVEYESKRKSKLEPKLVCSYKPVSESYYPAKGSFVEWMAERYCLYTVDDKGKILRGEILHPPWLLHDAQANFYLNTMLSKQGIEVENDEAILHFSQRKEVKIWPFIKED